MKIKILIVDDHPFTRAGVRSILESADTIEIAGEAKDGLEAIQQVKDHQPDIVVMDITMPNLSGIDATREILEHQPETKIIALSIHAGEQFVKGMLDAGAVAYLLKEEAPEELLLAIDKVNKGEMYLSSAVTRTALRNDEREEEHAGFNVLKTKLLRPPILNTSISRDSIIEELERNVGKPLTLVSAGAGYGKSITVSQWLEKSSHAHVWISLDEEHNDLRTFLLYLVEGIEMTIPGFLKETGRAIKGIKLPSLDRLLSILFNDLCDIDQDLILVLDNYHIINDKKIDQLLNEWLRFPPPDVHLCIITRRDPALKTRSLRSKGRITEIRMDKLSFTNEEIVKLFKQLSGIELDDHATQMLLEKTEGWIIPLRLASMVMQGLEDMDQVFQSFEGELNTLSDYLIEEVLSEIPVDIKNLLMTSSIPDRFCIELIEDISFTEEGKGRPEPGRGAEFLQWLLNENMFIVELDATGKWFRYNHLFKTLLNIQLRSNLGKDKTDQLHRKASLWFEQHEFLEEAMQHAMIIEDLDMAAQIVKKHRLSILSQNKGLFVEKLLSITPESLINSSKELLLARAYILLNHNKLEGFSEVVSIIEKLLEKEKDPEKLPYYGEFVFYQAHSYLYFHKDIAKSYDLLKLAMKLVPESQAELRGRTELLYALTAQMHGRYKEIHKDVLKLDVGPGVDTVLRNRRYRVLMMLPLIAAEPDKAGLQSLHALDMARASKRVEGIAWCLYLSALINMHKGEWQYAIAQFEELLDMKYSWDMLCAIDGISALITAYQLTAQSEKAGKLLNELVEFVKDMNPYYQQFLWAAKARYYTLIEDTESLAKLTGNQQINSPGNPQCYFDVPANTECRALIFEGSKSGLKLADERLNELIAISKGQHNVLHWIELLVYQSILFDKQGKNKESSEALLKAVSLAEPGKAKAYFVEMGKPIMEIFNKMQAEKKEHAYVRELISTISTTPFDHVEEIAKEPPKKIKVNVLTQREIEILHCVAEGLRNKEIAEKLFNSDETIKKHIYNMFIKMNVKNRLSLVIKARELGILVAND